MGIEKDLAFGCGLMDDFGATFHKVWLSIIPTRLVSCLQSCGRQCRLVDAFGSTRRKRQLQTREGAKVQADAIGGTEAVKSLLQTAGDKAAAAGATKAEVLGKAMGHRVLPPHNPQATTPQEAYKYSPPPFPFFSQAFSDPRLGGWSNQGGGAGQGYGAVVAFVVQPPGPPHRWRCTSIFPPPFSARPEALDLHA